MKRARPINDGAGRSGETVGVVKQSGTLGGDVAPAIMILVVRIDAAAEGVVHGVLGGMGSSLAGVEREIEQDRRDGADADARGH